MLREYRRVETGAAGIVGMDHKVYWERVEVDVKGG